MKFLRFSRVPCNCWVAGIIPLLERSTRTLRNFDLDTDTKVPDSILKSLFKHTSPDIKVLTIPHKRIPVELLARIVTGMLFPRLQVLECAINKSLAALEGLMDLIRNRCLGNAMEGPSYILSLQVLHDNYDPPGHENGVTGWPEAFDRFNALAGEVAKQGRVVVLESS